ncbi:MAG: cupin domain-containing protein [Alphaproteobacteria bacterium]
MSGLGTIDELPPDYRQALSASNVLPLWPSLRAALPYDKPARRARPVAWRYRELRPALLRAGELTPIEKAERRVLVLSNPGLGPDAMRAAPAIFIGLQLILPGEFAPNHRHSPSAVRFVIEGKGGYTVVQGEKLPMEKGDLILTPSGLWHQHGHEGKEPVIWLDALDLPTINTLEASYCVEGEPQAIRNEPDASQTRFRRAGLLPYQALETAPARYPLLRYPWREVREALHALSGVTPAGKAVQLAYVNPETGAECMPILGFSALMLRRARPWRRRGARPRRCSTSSRARGRPKSTARRWPGRRATRSPCRRTRTCGSPIAIRASRPICSRSTMRRCRRSSASTKC